MFKKKEAVWSDVDFDLWYNEVVFVFMENKQKIPDREHCHWHWKRCYGPSQFYYKMMGDKSREEGSDDDTGSGLSSSQQSR